MGAGCGKTCLIECLALRNRSFEGALRMNGKPARSTYLTDVAFVPQKDMLFGYVRAGSPFMMEPTVMVMVVGSFIVVA